MLCPSWGESKAKKLATAVELANAEGSEADVSRDMHDREFLRRCLRLGCPNPRLLDLWNFWRDLFRRLGGRTLLNWFAWLDDLDLFHCLSPREVFGLNDVPILRGRELVRCH
jgi:hypothetical protein